jgi:hypothetical protein
MFLKTLLRGVRSGCHANRIFGARHSADKKPFPGVVLSEVDESRIIFEAPSRLDPGMPAFAQHDGTVCKLRAPAFSNSP